MNEQFAGEDLEQFNYLNLAHADILILQKYRRVSGMQYRFIVISDSSEKKQFTWLNQDVPGSLLQTMFKVPVKNYFVSLNTPSERQICKILENYGFRGNKYFIGL